MMVGEELFPDLAVAKMLYLNLTIDNMSIRQGIWIGTALDNP